MTEAELVARARAGDRRAMAELYTAHAARVYSVVRRMVGDDAVADDVSQDAWVRAFEKLHLFRGDAAFGTWLHRLSVNVALNRLRRHGRRAEVERTVEPPPPLADADDRFINQRLIGQALDQLSSGYREVLVLHDVEGLTHEEIGQRLGIAPGTSKSQLHKARARMREMLAPSYGESEAGNHV
ncbi:MAG: RNA polymerase sigma factor [Gemmatimonadota bacterium]